MAADVRKDKSMADLAHSNTGEPIRVLLIISGNRYFGGISSLFYNIYCHIDRNKVQFDFLYPYFASNGIYRDNIESMGGHVYELGIDGNKLDRKWKLYPQIKEYLRRHAYQIVHINSGNFLFNLIVSKAAKDAGIPNIFVHSHSVAAPDSPMMKRMAIRLLKPALEKQLTMRCACSTIAGEFMFSKKTLEEKRLIIIKNAIELKKFGYNEAVRNEMRNELGVQGKHVVGHVGRFSPEKNQGYLVKVFSKLVQKDPDAVLVLLGYGENELEAKVRKQVEDLKLTDKVHFLGLRTDVERCYQAFDAFAFPSIWEGLGMVLVEAQVAGLHCVASSAVSREADVTGNVVYLDLGEKDIDLWAEAIEKAFSANRCNCVDMARDAGYDIDTVANNLAKLYLSIVNKT